MARKKHLGKVTSKSFLEKRKEDKKKIEEKDPYDEALEILQQYEEGNPPILNEPED